MNSAGTAVTLTVRGWAVLTTTVVLAATAALFGIEELFAVATAASILLVSCALWVWRRPWNLGSGRQVRPQLVPTGAAVQVELGLLNRSGQPSPVVAARDGSAGGRSWAAFAVAPLQPGEMALTSYRLPTFERGVFEVGPLILELTDPFGLVSATRTGAAASTLTVHPRTVALRPPRRSNGSARPQPEAAAMIGQHGSDLYAVREYRTGDDLRRVHWPSTARLGELMIRQEETPTQSRLTVDVDLRKSTWVEGGLETALSVAASLFDDALGDKIPVRLRTSAGVDTGFISWPEHRYVALDALARAQETASGPLPSGVGRLAKGGLGEATVVVTSLDAAGRDAIIGCAVARLGPATVVLVAPDRRDGSAAPSSRVRPAAMRGTSIVVVDGGIDAFPLAWARRGASLLVEQAR